MKKWQDKKMMNKGGGAGGFALFVGFWGAVVYFVQQSVGFWGFILALLKAVVWPAYVVYHVLLLFRA